MSFAKVRKAYLLIISMNKISFLLTTKSVVRGSHYGV